MPNFTGQNDLRNYLRAAWRWRWLILAIVIIVPLITWAVESSKTKIYESQTIISISPNQVNYGNNSTNAAEATNVVAIAQMIETTNIANIAGKLLSPPVAGDQIGAHVQATSNAETNWITITATADSPQRAANVATAFANAIGLNMTSSAQKTLQAQINTYTSEIQKAPKDQRPALEAQRLQYQQLLSRQTLTTTVQQAEVDNTPISPHVRRSVEVAFLVGILLAVAAVLLLESLDRRLHSPEDLEAATNLPLLATIPPTVFADSLNTGPIDEEAFQMLRTSISYFTTDRALSTLLIASPGEKEGKSTVAARLALTAASAGQSVILVDADLRRGGASKKFHLNAVHGLSSVLLGQVPVESELVNWTLPEGAVGKLQILPAGPPPINASALLSSDQTKRLLARLSSMADLVVVDSPASLAVSDAVPLMKVVSGIVVVARMSQSAGQTIARLLKIIDSAQGKVLGLVATGVGSHDAYYNYSNGYYSHDDDRTAAKGWRKLLQR